MLPEVVTLTRIPPDVEVQETHGKVDIREYLPASEAERGVVPGPSSYRPPPVSNTAPSSRREFVQVDTPLARSAGRSLRQP